MHAGRGYRRDASLPPGVATKLVRGIALDEKHHRIRAFRQAIKRDHLPPGNPLPRPLRLDEQEPAVLLHELVPAAFVVRHSCASERHR